MTHVWSDRLEGYGEIAELSQEHFRAGFHYLTGSRSLKVQPYWSEDGDNLEQLLGEGQMVVQLGIPLKQIFNAPRCFFMTQNSGVYGVGTSRVTNGDKVAFLFP